MPGDEVVKRIVMKYSSEGLEQITQKVQSYNAATKEMTTTTNVGPSMDKLTTMSQTVNKVGGSYSALGSQMNGVMLRFIGLNAIISYATQAYHQLRQFIDDGVASFRSFEVQMAQVNAILTSTSRNALPALEVGITQLSVQYGKSVDDLAKSLQNVTKAGFSVTDSMDILNTATKVSIAANATLETSVNTLTEVLNAYGMSASNVEVIADKLFQTMARGSLTFDSLQSALGYILPIASDAGIAFDDISAAISTATRQGQHIDSVTRGLGLMLQGLLNPTKAVTDALDKYGIQVDATSLETNGLTGFLEQVNEAMKKYGSQILPDIVTNMRSLRVAMALTSDEGIKGMTTDMQLLQDATGRTETALSSMMNTQQKYADILSQSMEKVGRSVGEAWSGVDIWWKKAQLWWGTLVSGGDADKAVQAFDSAVYQIRQSYIDNMVTPAKSGEPTVLDKLTKGISVRTAVPWDILNQYSKGAVDLETYNTKLTNVKNAEVLLQQVRADANKNFTWKQSGPLTGSEQPQGVQPSKNLDLLNVTLKELGITPITASTSIAELDNILKELNTTDTITVAQLENLNNTQTELRPTVDQVTSAFADLKTQITDTETNILNLNSDIANLNSQLNVPYKGYDSILKYGVAVSEAKMQNDEFSESAKMAAKYGPEYINEFTNVFDQYGNNMGDVLRTIYDYNSALKKTEQITKETTDANHELEIAMEQNNIQMLKLQLTGMMRRRGNTRAEQKEMKQIEIENTKIRIQEMQNSYNADVETDAIKNNDKKTAYDEAEEILTSYTDFEQHQLWVLEDTRSEDTQNLRDNITKQQGLLEQKTLNLQTETTKLTTLQTLYVSSLETIASDPNLASAYRKFFGTDAAEDAIAAMQSLQAFQTGLNPNAKTVNTKTVTVAGQTLATSNINTAQLTHQLGNLERPLRGYETGVDYVPSTGAYMLHQGERVVSANQNGGGSPITINVINPVVSNPNDLAKLSNNFENIIRANLLNKQTGKSKYRMA